MDWIYFRNKIEFFSRLLLHQWIEIVSKSIWPARIFENFGQFSAQLVKIDADLASKILTT